MARKVLNFEYCECGCKGYSAGVGDNSYWIYWDLKETYTLIAGHGWCGGPVIGKYSTYEKAIDEATKRFRFYLKEINQCLIDNDE